MLERFLAEHIWLVLLLWGIVYSADYYLTIYGAHLYHTSLKEHIVFAGSYELTPQFQRDIDTLQHFSPRFIRALGLSLVLIFLIWFLAVVVISMPELFSLATGALFLREAAIHLRHSRNIALARLSRDSGGLSGQVHYSRWLILNLSTIELWSYVGLYLLLGVVVGSWFLAGGALSCSITAFQHWRQSRKQNRLSN